MDFSKVISVIKEVETDLPTFISGLKDLLAKLHGSTVVSVIESHFPALKTLDDDAVKVLEFFTTLEPATISILDKLLSVLNAISTPVSA